MTLSTSNRGSARPRIRARHACIACQARRVRCNVTEANPCFNCLSAGSSCEIAPSKRGRHKRKPKPSDEATHLEPSGGSVEGSAHTSNSAPDDTIASGRAQTSPQDVQSVNSLPTVLSLREQPEPVAPSSISDADTASANLINAGMFFGESNALTSVASKQTRNPLSPVQSSPGQKSRHYAVPQDSTPRAPDSHLSGALQAVKERILREHGVLDVPSSQQVTPILQAYFRWFHPYFPILDKAAFSTQFLEDKVSLLLLNAILFVGVTYADDEMVHALGYKNLGEAKSQLYNKTKLLFEADWETNSLAILQTLFLLTFLRVPMNSVKGHRYWLSAAINLAHLHGLHRTSSHGATVNGSLCPQTRLQRRIWWSLYVREIHSSTSLGLPARINDLDCDIPELCPSDVEEREPATLPWLAESLTKEQIVYMVQMPRLMSLLARVSQHFFAPRPLPDKGCTSRDDFMIAIEAWRAGLPSEMQVAETDGRPLDMWTCLLHLAYNHIIMLLHRDDLINRRSGGQKALQAARRVTSIVEELLANEMIKYSQLYFITSVFAALCIHTIYLQQETGVARRLSENRAKTCLLALKEAQKSWHINNDMLELFLQHIEVRLATEFRKEVADYAPVSRAASLPRAIGASSAGVASSLAVPDTALAAQDFMELGREIDLDERANPMSSAFAVPGHEREDVFPFFASGMEMFAGDLMGIPDPNLSHRSGWF